MGNTTLSASNRYALGLGFLWSWGYIAHHSPAMLVDDATVGQLDVLFLCSLITGILCFGLIALCHRWFTETVLSSRWKLVLYAVLASSATALMPLSLSVPAGALLVGVVSEIATCFLFIAWGCAIFSLKIGEVRVALVKTAAVIAVATIASQLASGFFSYGATVVFPLLSVALLPSGYAEKMRSARVRFVAPRTAFSSFKRFFLVILSFGMAFGCFRFVIFSALGGARNVSTMYFVGYGIGAVSLFLVTRFFRNRIDETVEFKAVLPLTVLSLIMLTFSGPARMVGAPVLLGCGNICFDTIEWALVAAAVLRTRMSPALCFSGTLCFSWVGTLCGSALGMLSSNGWIDPLVAPMAGVLCLVTAGMAMLGRLSILAFDAAGSDATTPPAADEGHEPEGSRPVVAAEEMAMSERFGLPSVSLRFSVTFSPAAIESSLKRRWFSPKAP